MVEYYIEAIDPRGRNTSLKIEAKNSVLADEMARAQGLHPTLITHAKRKKRDEKQAADRRKRRQFGLIGAIVVLAVLAIGGGVWIWIQELEAAGSDTGVNYATAGTDRSRVASRAFGGNPELTDFAHNLYIYLDGKYPGTVRGLTVPSDNTLLVELGYMAEQQPATLSTKMAEHLADMMHGIFSTDAAVTISYGTDDIAKATFVGGAITVESLRELGIPVEGKAEAEDVS